MKISIVMAYFNRRQQLLTTLKSITASTDRSNIEVIIVDDVSDSDERSVTITVIEEDDTESEDSPGFEAASVAIALCAILIIVKLSGKRRDK